MSGFYVGAEFYRAVEENNFAVLTEGIAEIENRLFKAWNSNDRQIFDDVLSLSVQRTKRVRGQLPGWQDNPAFQIGKLEGIVQAYTSLFQEEKRQAAIEQEITAMMPKMGSVTRKIFSKLYDLSADYQWITHSELAEAVQTSDSSLSNIMKKLLRSRAVESEKNGKYTNYRLTQGGKRYYEKNIAPSLPDKANTQILDCLSDLALAVSKLEGKVEQRQNDQELDIPAVEDLFYILEESKRPIAAISRNEAIHDSIPGEKNIISYNTEEYVDTSKLEQLLNKLVR